MTPSRFLFLCSISVVLTLPLQNAAQQVKATETEAQVVQRLYGDWSGESICVDKKKFPACSDEKVVYHITRVVGKTDTVNLSADKIVNGKPEFMGAFDFTYDPAKLTLTGEFKNTRVHIVMVFIIKGDVLEGTMTDLPGGSLVRRMNVKKNK